MFSRKAFRPIALTLLYLLFLVSIGGIGEVLVRIFLAFNTVYDIEMTRYSNEVKITSDTNLAHEHRPFAVATLMNVDVQINSDGLRDREYSSEPSDAYRIIFLGDSLTFGWGVQRKDTFEYRLEERLNEASKVEILNFGIGNYNTQQELGLFVKKGLKYHPDKVVVFYFINDAEPTPQLSELAFRRHSRLLTFAWSRINIILSKYSQNRGFLHQYSQLYVEGQPGWKATKGAFRTLRSLSAQNNIALQVVLLPELHDLRSPPFQREYALVEQFLNDEAIPVLDLTPYFAGVEDPLSLWVAEDDAHPNSEAHRMIADFSQQFISPASE